MFKSEGLQQPQNTSSNKRIVFILIAVIVVAVSVFTVRVIGDENEGIDHVIEYSNEEIWELTYSALGIDPYDETETNRKATASLGSSSNVMATGNEELDQWINREIAGNYLVDRIREEDGCEALLVMDPENNELSIIALNLEDDFHTFNMKITDPDPLVVDVEIYKVEDIHLGFSLGASGEKPIPSKKRDSGGIVLNPEEADDTIDKAPSAPKTPVKPEDSTTGRDDGELPSVGDFQGLLDGMSTSSSSKGTVDSLLSPVNSEGSQADLGGVPVRKETPSSQTGEEEESSKEDGNPFPKADESAPLDKSKDSSTPTETKREESKSQTEPAKEENPTESKKIENKEIEKEAVTEKETAEETTNEKTDKTSEDVPPPESTASVGTPQDEEKKETPESKGDVVVLLPEDVEELEEEKKENNPKPPLEDDFSKEEQPEIHQFQKDVFENPKNGVLVTVPSNGVAIAKITINENLLRLSDKGMTVQDGDVFVLEKKSETHASYLTRSRDDHKLRFGVEEDTQIRFNGTGTEKITIELNTQANLTVGQIITTVDTLSFVETPENPLLRTLSTGEESHLTVNSVHIAGKDFSDGISGSNHVEFAGNLTVDVLSEVVGGSGISAKDSIVIKENAVVSAEGETFGIRVFGEEGNLVVDNGHLLATVQPSKSNKGATPIVGVYASGDLDFSGGSLVSTVVQSQTIPQDEILVRSIEEIHAAAQTYAYHVNNANLITSTGGTLKASGGDIGLCVEETFLVEGNAHVEVSAYWVGILIKGSNSIIQSDSHKNAPTVTALANGETASLVPYGYGIAVFDALSIKKKSGSYIQGSKDHYNQNTAPKVTAEGSQIGIYMNAGKLENNDGSELQIKGGVTGVFDGKTPELVVNTYGAYFAQDSLGIDTRYNAKTMAMGGYMGLHSAHIPIDTYTPVPVEINTWYSAYLNSVGNYAGIAGDINMYSAFSSKTILHGNIYGALITTDKIYYGPSLLYVGRLDTHAGAEHTNGIFSATATEGIGYYGVAGMRVYDYTYCYFEGDTAGFLGQSINPRNVDGGEIIIVGKTSIYENNDPRDRIPTPPTSHYEGYPIRRQEGRAIANEYIGMERVVDQIIEVYDAKDSGFGWYSQSQGMQAQFNGESSVRQLFHYGDGMTPYNWSIGSAEDINKFRYIDPLSIAESERDNMNNYSYMQFGREIIPHDFAEFAFERYSLGEGYGVGTIRGVGISPKNTQKDVMVIADSENPYLSKTVPGWSDNKGFPYAGTGPHRLVFLNLDILAEREGHLFIEYYYDVQEGRWHEDITGTNIVNRGVATFDFEYLPLDAPPGAEREKFTATLPKISDNYKKHAFDRMTEGYYWITDTDANSSRFEVPQTIQLKIYREKVNDEFGDEYPYYKLKAEILNDPNDVVAEVGEFISITYQYNVYYGEESHNIKTPPQGLSNAYNLFPRFEKAELRLYYHRPRFTLRYEARSQADPSVKIPGTVRIREVSSPAYPEVSDFHIDNTHSFEDEIFEEIYRVTYDTLYDMQFFPDDPEYMPSKVSKTIIIKDVLSGTAGSGDTLEITKTVKSYRADLTFHVAMYETDVDLKTVLESSDGSLVLASGAKYELTESYNGVAKTPVAYTDTENNGIISLKGLKINHEYFLKQTTPPINGDPLENDTEFQFSLTPKKDSSGEIIGWTITPTGLQEPPWIGLSTDNFVTIKNPGAPYFDYPVEVRAHGLWQHHGESSFTVKLEQKVATGKPHRVYYKNVDFSGNAKTKDVSDSCYAFGATVAKTEEHIAGCASTESEVVTFENVEPGTYNISVLSSLRFEDSPVTPIDLPPLPSVRQKITVEAKRQRYFSDATHVTYNFTLA